MNNYFKMQARPALLHNILGKVRLFSSLRAEGVWLEYFVLTKPSILRGICVLKPGVI
jgi:hypothetical protein